MKLIATVFLITFFAHASVPNCQVDPKYVSAAKGNAGCFVVFEGKMLLVRGKKNGKLTMPAGRWEKGETAQCTAHRETWEESGVSVRVHELLKKFKNEFHLFRCTVLEPEKLKGKTTLPISKDWMHEITEIRLQSPLELKKKQWRYPKQLKLIKKLFKKLLVQSR